MRDTKDDLREFKELYETDTYTDEIIADESVTFDSIMSEYKFESVSNKKVNPNLSREGDTGRLMRLADELAGYAKDAESAREKILEEMPEKISQAEEMSGPEKLLRAEAVPKTEKLSRTEAVPKTEELSRTEAVPKTEEFYHAGVMPKPEEFRAKEIPRPEEDRPVVDEAFFGLPEDFEKAFAPSEDFVKGREEDYDRTDSPVSPGLFERFRQYIKTKQTPEDITPGQACARLSPYVISLRLRLLAAFIVYIPLLIMLLSVPLGFPVPSFLSYSSKPYIYLLISSLLMLAIMVLGADVLAKGFSDFLHFRPGMESLVCVSCVATLCNVISIMAANSFVGFLPYIPVSAASVIFSMLGHYCTQSARRRTYKVASFSDKPDSVFVQEQLWEGLPGITRRAASTDGFVSRTEIPDVSHRVMSFIAPILIIAQFLLALMVSVGRDEGSLFFWAWSAISASCAPFSIALCSSLSFSAISKRLAKKGAAIAGFSAAKAIAGSMYIVTSDTDFFPNDMISLNGLKLFGDYKFDKITSMAASLLAASGSGAYRAIQSVSKEGLHSVSHFEHYEGGGVGGDIDGTRVLLGSASFILRMGIRLQKEMNIKNAVFIALDMDVAGIFAINYISSKTVENSLLMLLDQRLTPVLAVRDFNITPEMLKKHFGINSDMLEYPTIEDRLNLSDPAGAIPSKPAAILIKQGLVAYAESVIGAIRLFGASKLCTGLSLGGTVIGLLLSFLLTYLGTSEAALSIAPHNVLGLSALWCVPVLIISSGAKRY